MSTVTKIGLARENQIATCALGLESIATAGRRFVPYSIHPSRKLAIRAIARQVRECGLHGWIFGVLIKTVRTTETKLKQNSFETALSQFHFNVRTV